MTVDERVVSMQFDNQRFEASASTTLNTIDRLKDALQFQDSANGFQNITNAANNVRLDALGNAVDAVKVKFSALEFAALSVMSNLVNRAISAGASIIKSLTISPIMDGFGEYETKMGSIQTIMANVNNSAKTTAASTAANIESAATGASKAASGANKQAQKDLKAAQKAELKAFDTEAKAELEAYNKGAKEELKELQKAQKEQTEAAADAYEDRLDALNKELKAEQKALQDNYKAQKKDLESSQTAQLDALKKAHQERLDMYEEEYLAKVKTIDEERYNELQAIQDQIDALNELTEAENKAAKEKTQQEKLASLQQAADVARSSRKRQETEKALNDYKQELATEQAQEERKQQIESLKDQMDQVKDLYDERLDGVKDEYNAQKEAENDLYQQQYTALRNQQTLEREAAQELYQQQLEALQERQSAQRKALQEQYQEEREALQEQLQAEQEALQEKQQKEREAIQDRQQEEKEAIQDRQSAELEAISSTGGAASAAIASTKDEALAAVDSVKEAAQQVTLEDVTKALGDLNTYADQTIYNFAEMTANIGRFTAAGVGLQDSVDAIKGISNVAAMAGVDSTHAANAMYQLSQALAAGRIQLQDWKSVEQAGMGGAALQQSLIETAKLHGVAIDQMIAQQGSFRNTLQKGWLTTELFIETMRTFTGDLEKEDLLEMGYSEQQAADIMKRAQDAVDAATKVRTLTQLMGTLREEVGSGWAETFEIVVGNFDEATELFSGVHDYFSQLISDQADQRNEMLQAWKDAGGRDSLIRSIQNMWEGLQSVILPVRKAFADLFPKVTAEKLVNLTKNFELLTEKFKIGIGDSRLLHGAFQGLASIFDLAKSAVKAVFDAFKPGAGVLTTLNQAFLKIISTVGRWITVIAEVIKQSGVFEKVTQVLQGAIGLVAGGIKAAIDQIKEWVSFEIPLPDTRNVPKYIEDFKAFFAPMKEQFNEVRELAGEFFKGFLGDFEDFKGTFSDVGDFIKGRFDGAIENIKSIPQDLKDIFKEIHDNLVEFFTNTKKDVDDATGESGGEGKGLFGNLRTAFDNFLTFCGGFIDGVKEMGGKIVGALTDFVKSILGEIDMGTIFAGIGAANAIGMTRVTFSFGDIMKSLAKLIDSGTGVVNNFGEMQNQLVSSLKTLQKEIKADIIEKIGKSMLMFAGAMFVLAQIDTNKIGQVIGGMATIMGGLGAMMKMIGVIGAGQLKISKSGIEKTTTSIGSTAIEFAAAVYLLAVAMKKVASIDPAVYGDAEWAMLELGTILTVGMGALYNADAEAKAKGGGGQLAGLIGFGFAMVELAEAFKIVAGVDWDGWLKACLSMVELGGILVIAIKSIYKASDEAPKGTLDGLIGFGFALDEMAFAFRMVAATKWEDILKGMAGIAELAIIMWIVIPEIYQASNAAEKGSLKGLIAFAFSLDLMAVAMNFIALLSWEGLAQGFLGIGALATIMCIAIPKLMAASKEAKKGQLMPLLSFALALDLMAVPMAGIAKMDWAGIAKGLAGLGGMAGEMVIVMAALKKITEGEFDAAKLVTASAAMVVLAAALTLLTAPMLVFSRMSLGQLVTALIALAGALGIFGAAAMLLKGTEQTMIALGGGIALLGVGLAGVGVGLLAFSAGLMLLAGTTSGAVITILATIQGLVLGVLEIIISSSPKIAEAFLALLTAGCTAIQEGAGLLIETILKLVLESLTQMATYMPQIVDTIITLIISVIDALTARLPELVHSVMGFVSALINAVMEEVKNINMQPFIDACEGMGIVTSLIALIAGVGKLAGPAATGMLKIGAVIVELIAVLTVIGGINQIPGIQWLVTEGGNLLMAVGEAIGKFVGGIVGGFGEGVTASLPAIGQNLSDFMDSVSGFITGAQQITPGSMDGVKDLAAAILVLTASNLLDGITKFFTGGKSTLSDFGKELEDFADPFWNYYDKIKDMEPSVVTASSYAAKCLAEMAATLPNDGGVLGGIMGENDLSTFAKELEEFGPALVGFAGSVEDLETDDVQKAIDAAEIVRAFADTIPNEGGLVAMITGDNSLSKFATELVIFGPLLYAFAESVDGLKTDAVEKAIASAEIINGLATKLPDHGGIVSVFTGDNTLSAFAADLVLFGPCLMKFAESVDGLKTEAVENAATAAEAMFNVVDKLPPSGGLVQVWDGSQDLFKFAVSLPLLGEGMAKFAEKIDGMNTEDVLSAAAAASALAAVNDALPDTGGLKSWIFGDQDLGDFGDNLEDLGEGLSAYYDKIKDIEVENMTDAIEAINRIINIATRLDGIDLSQMTFFGDNLATMSTNGITAFVNTFIGSDQKVSEGIETMISYVCTAIDGGVELVVEPAQRLGDGVITGFKSGIDLGSPTVAGSIELVINNLTQTMARMLQPATFMLNGNNIMEWLKQGIANKMSVLESQVKTVCNSSIIDKFKLYLPETTFKTIAQNVMTYIKNGISNSESIVTTQIKTTCANLVTSFKNNMVSSKYEPAGKQAVQGVADGIMDNESLAENAASTLASNVKTEIETGLSYQKFYNIADSIVDGIVNGLNEERYRAEEAAEALARAVEEASKTELGVESPSKVFHKIGNFVVMGFANGIINNIRTAVGASEDMSVAVIDPVNAAVQRIAESMEDVNSEFQPTITPVVDLRNVNAAAGAISSTFSGMRIGTSSGLAQSISGGFMSARSMSDAADAQRSKDLLTKIDKLATAMSQNTGKIENTNTFNIRSTDPKQAAEEVGYIMQHQIERRKAVWAR